MILEQIPAQFHTSKLSPCNLRPYSLIVRLFLRESSLLHAVNEDNRYTAIDAKQNNQALGAGAMMLLHFAVRLTMIVEIIYYTRYNIKIENVKC
jgi:hypothetical protein